jgi:hypothetical protein
LKFSEIQIWIQRLIHVLKLNGYWKIVTKDLANNCYISWPICARYFSTFDCHIDIFAVFVGKKRFLCYYFCCRRPSTRNQEQQEYMSQKRHCGLAFGHQIFHSEKYNKYFNTGVESVNNFSITSS